jgi:hypothetical protein
MKQRIVFAASVSKVRRHQTKMIKQWAVDHGHENACSYYRAEQDRRECLDPEPPRYCGSE